MTEIRPITFDEILPVWSAKLWPGRASAIRPLSSLAYFGGHDMTIYDTATPYFVGAFADGILVGVNSGFKTAPDVYRSRGIWVDEGYGRRGVGRLLLDAVMAQGRAERCVMIWTMPRQTAMPFYQRCGFVRTSEWFDEGVEFGPNCYAARDL